MDFIIEFILHLLSVILDAAIMYYVCCLAVEKVLDKYKDWSDK